MRTFQEFMMIVEGMSMKDFKANRRKLKRREASADAKKRGHVGKEWYNSGRTYSPDEAKRGRAKLDDAERRTRHRSSIDPEGEDSNYSADKTKNPKKLRKQKAMGELGESHYRFESLEDRRDEIDSKRKETIEKQREKLEDREDRNQLKKEIKNEIKQELSSEAYDADVMGSSQIRRMGDDERIGPDRKLPPPQRRRRKAVGGGETEPVEYKERKDAKKPRGSVGPAPGRPAGKDGKSSTNLEPGTAGTKGSAKLSDKERQRKAYAERKARERGEEQPKTASQAISQSQPEKKPVSPDYTPPKASGMTRAERMSQQRKGEAMLKDIMKDQEFSRYEKETGQKATGKAKTKLLGRVAQRMTN